MTFLFLWRKPSLDKTKLGKAFEYVNVLKAGKSSLRFESDSLQIRERPEHIQQLINDVYVLIQLFVSFKSYEQPAWIELSAAG